MGNGPSLSDLDFEKIMNDPEVVTFATNRISLIFDRTNWRPDYYTCFAVASRTDKKWKDSIKKTVNNESTTCFLLKECKKWLGERNNVTYVTPYEHYRHSRIPNNLFETTVEQNFLKSYSATVSIIQLALSYGFKELYIIGQDGYQKNKKNNHFSKKYNGRPSSFDKTNNRLIKLHNVVKEHCNKNGVKVKNMSKHSILKMYENSDMFIKKDNT